MDDAPRFRPVRTSGVRSTGTDPVLVLAALAVAGYVVVFPFTEAHYPPLTDLPFHAAQASILRHYFDPAYHFREQFTLHPLEAPYVSMYVIGAALAFVMPIAAATKAMSIAMLALVPAGLAVLLRGMKKSPLWAVLGLGLVWCTCTQWGFLSYMGATGLLAMSTGLALMVVDEPTRTRKVMLGVTLVAIFFTHVYRFPFAIAGALAAGAFVFPVTRRFSGLIRPLVPSLLLFVLWIAIRPSALSPGFMQLGFHPERFGYVFEHLFGAYLPQDGFPATAEGSAEHVAGVLFFTFAALAAVVTFALRALRREPRTTAEEASWDRRVNAFALLYAGGLFVLFLTLPLEVGQWFFVYPREIVGVALFLIAALPELPRARADRAAVVALMSLAVVPMTHFVTKRFREFDAATADFRAIVADTPAAPRLLYLVYTFAGSNKRASPFLHLPAWVQAEKGGALAFHFAQWGLYPVRYRVMSPNVPPAFAPGFEWNPQYFDVLRDGPWFDTFLVRHDLEPHELFDRDPTVHRVDHQGTWWLYRRSR
ncbi:MAG TPA: hypothetical protein VH062_05415 [Polyangiaceae bacterium]|jgi:hypothetical protein|nr:hypothetical protein [Polyangiaceae bacterium]